MTFLNSKIPNNFKYIFLHSNLNLILIQLAQVFFFFLELIDYPQITLFDSKSEVHSLRSKRPTINQFEKRYTKSVLIERKQVDKKIKSKIW